MTWYINFLCATKVLSTYSHIASVLYIISIIFIDICWKFCTIILDVKAPPVQHSVRRWSDRWRSALQVALLPDQNSTSRLSSCSGASFLGNALTVMGTYAQGGPETRSHIIKSKMQNSLFSTFKTGEMPQCSCKMKIASIACFHERVFSLLMQTKQLFLGNTHCWLEQQALNIPSLHSVLLLWC